MSGDSWRSRLPRREELTICFAHGAYQLGKRFSVRQTGIGYFEVRDFAALAARVAEADVLVVSGLWRNELIGKAAKLRFIQSISAGVDQYATAALSAAGICLASAQGVNERAVAEHAVALMLALMRRLGEARDHQNRRHWRGMISDPAEREDELCGKTLLVVGLGRIGSRLARLARAFEMRVLATKTRPEAAGDAADLVLGPQALLQLLPEADVVALTCPLTAQTEKLIAAQALAAMKPTAVLINVARGKIVDELALIAALERKELAGAALDCFYEEPLAASSPLWSRKEVLITPHSAGETRRYEDNVLDVLLDNLERLWRGASLHNEIVG